MAGRGYLNTFEATTPIGQSMQNIAMALFGGADADAQNAVRMAQIREHDARARYLASQTAENEQKAQIANENAQYLQSLRNRGPARAEAVADIAGGGIPAIVAGQYMHPEMGLPNPIDPVTKKRYMDIPQADANKIDDANAALASYLTSAKLGVANPTSMMKAVGEAQDNRFERDLYAGHVPTNIIQQAGWYKGGRDRFDVKDGVSIDQLSPSQQQAVIATPVGASEISLRKEMERTEKSKQNENNAQAGVRNAQRLDIEAGTNSPMVPVQQPDGSIVYMTREQAAGKAVPPKPAAAGKSGAGGAVDKKALQKINSINGSSQTALEAAEEIERQLQANPTAKNAQQLNNRLRDNLEKIRNGGGFVLTGDPAADASINEMRKRYARISGQPQAADPAWWEANMSPYLTGNKSRVQQPQSPASPRPIGNSGWSIQQVP